MLYARVSYIDDPAIERHPAAGVEITTKGTFGVYKTTIIMYNTKFVQEKTANQRIVGRYLPILYYVEQTIYSSPSHFRPDFPFD